MLSRLRLLPRLHPPRLRPPILRPPQCLHPQRQHILPRRFNRFTSTLSPPLPSSPPPPTSLSARFKHLSREYGYSALGVYLLLSALDFPFCFLAVRYFGTDRIAGIEERVIGFAKPYWAALKRQVGIQETAEIGEVAEGESENAGEESSDSRGASIWTQLALAYAVHKSFIFIRIPLTVAVTPKVVKVLRGWGWDIGKKGKPKIGSVPGRKKN